MMPAVQLGGCGAEFLAESAFHFVLAKFADESSGRAADDDRCQARTRERAHDQADADADLDSSASEVVAGLIHG